MSITHYIATDTDRTAIYGLGDSPELAIADAERGAADGAYITLPCSDALAAEVEGADGCINWDEVDGVAQIGA